MADMKLNYNTSMFRVCMDSKTTGKIVSRRLTAPIHFNDMSSMLLALDTIMDAQDYPRAFQRTRQFDERKNDSTAGLPYARAESEMMPEAEVASARGSSLTLTLQVITRQNSTWQGAVILEDGRRLAFVSVLQLLELFDSLAAE